MDYPRYVENIINRLEDSGHEAYIVGGSVRDILLSKEPHDYDVTTSAKPEAMLEIFADMRTIPTGIKHGTLTVMSEGNPIEVTTFRIDGEYLDSRRPESVIFTDDVSADLSRRDFTVNAMAYSKKRGIIDVFGGKSDLEKGIIRAVRDPEERFREDALRIMRAFRFSSQLGFAIEENTLSAAKKMRSGLANIAAERIAAEFIRTICNSTVDTTLKLMDECGVLEYAIGACKPDKKILQALKASDKTPEIRLAILLSSTDADVSESILRSLKLSNKLISDVKRISSQLRAGLSGTVADARRLIGSSGELIYAIMNAGAALGVLDKDFEGYLKEAIEKNERITIGALAVHGDDLIKLGIKGKAVGELLEYLLMAVLEDPTLNNKQELLALAKAKISNNGENNG